MTPKEIVAKWIETEWLSHDPAIRDAENAIVSGLVADIQQAITAAVADEREACAKILDSADSEPYCGFQIAELARQIRARGEKK